MKARSWAATAFIMVPVVFLAWMGWRHRWTSDDAFINFRVVRQLGQGHGLVYNAGDRVEAATSPAWVVTLAALDVLTPIRLEWIAVFASLAATVGGLTLAILGTRRALLRSTARAGTYIPLGALVYAVLPPAWDFTTSGLENGLGVLWIGSSWWLLTKWIETRGDAQWRQWWIPVVVGLGPLVRPDFAIFSAAFLIALVLTGERRWKPVVFVLATALVLPAASELFRMAYYANIVPNTAIAKEASLSNWQQGWKYLRDFFAPYVLLLPVLVLAGAFLAPVFGRGRGRNPRLSVLVGCALVGGLVHGLYVVRVGGDFMHARMLLPSLLVTLLPVSVVPVTGWRWLAATALAVWAIACAAGLRTPYSGPPPKGQVAAPALAGNFASGITDERLFYMRLAGTSHPVTIDDYANSFLGRIGLAIDHFDVANRRGFVLGLSLLPAAPDAPATLVAYVGAAGITAYAAGDDVFVLDSSGLANAVSAHQRLLFRGRPGHEKDLPASWMFARFAAADAQLPTGLNAADVQAARRALQCGDLRELLASEHDSLSPAHLIRNVMSSVRNSRLRYSSQPQIAEHELCR
jgi:arabinofuranosyltransferase